jgi:hypothetical protein
MTTKKAYIIIMAAVLIAAMITVIKVKGYYSSQPVNQLSAQCFQTTQGWGYNILAGQKILIHQPMVPGKSGNKGFETEQQAAASAQAMISDIRAGRTP